MSRRKARPPLEGTFPNNSNAPARGPECIDTFAIANDVAGDLVPPELIAGFWPPEQMAVMAMPEAAMHKEHRIEARKDHVRTARQAGVQAISEPESVKPLPKHQFGLCILATDSGHHPAADFRRDYVSH